MIGFYVPPAPIGTRQVTRVAEGFLETRWTAADLEAPIRALDWTIRERHVAASRGQDEVWVLVPARAAGIPSVAGGAGMASAGRSLKFSIIMPTYRRAHCLNATMATILAQTYSNWLIVIDNAGDSQVAIADPRISTHVHTERSSAVRPKGPVIRHRRSVLFLTTMTITRYRTIAAPPRPSRQNGARRQDRCARHVNYSYATPGLSAGIRRAETDGPCQISLTIAGLCRATAGRRGDISSPFASRRAARIEVRGRPARRSAEALHAAMMTARSDAGWRRR